MRRTARFCCCPQSTFTARHPRATVDPEIPHVKVLVAGGGYGGLETALALEDALAERVEITLLTATVNLTYRPLSSGAPFVREPAHTIDIHRLAAERGMRVVLDELVNVQEDECRVMTHDGELIDFDALVIAVGAHERGPAPPLITWGQEPDQGQLGALLDELAAGTVKSVAVTIPAGAGWPLAGYEAALILAWTASHLAPAPVSVTVITVEERPASGPRSAGGRLGEQDPGRRRRRSPELDARHSSQSRHPDRGGVYRPGHRR